MARPIPALLGLTEDQWGLVTRSQAQLAGVASRTLARQVERGVMERVAHGVYRLRAAGEPDHLALRAAWLQLDPDRPAWERLDDPDVAVVSHASAADLYDVGDLRADIHEFTIRARRQTRRPDVRLHNGRIPPEGRIVLHGLPVTRAGWMVGDLLADHVEPGAIAQITNEVVDRVLDYPRDIADRLAPHAARFGFSAGDGVALLDYLLEFSGRRERRSILEEARAR